MIVKLKGVEGSRLAALWAIAEKPEFQYVFDEPQPFNPPVSRECTVTTRPAIKVLECKAVGNVYEASLEIAHGFYYIEEKEGDLITGKGKKVPIPRALVLAVFNALNLYPDSVEADKNVTNLLKQIMTVKAAGAAKFVAEDHLKSANVGWTGDNFKKLFLKKMEENVGDAAIAIDRLERASKDAPIMTELGARAEIKLAHFFGLLEA